MKNEISVEAQAFLAKHAATGEPSSEALARVRAKLASPTLELVSARQKRRWVPTEALAVAAVLLICVAGSAVYWLSSRVLVHEPVVVAKTSSNDRVLALYRSNDLEGAIRAASQPECEHDYDCRGTLISLDDIRILVSQLDELTVGELLRLQMIDRQLAGDVTTEIRARVRARLSAIEAPPKPPATRGKPPVAEAERLISQARENLEEKNYDAALSRLARCLEVDDMNFVCIRLTASTLAKRGNADDIHKAREFYELYVKVAPADDPYVPRVRSILGVQ